MANTIRTILGALIHEYKGFHILRLPEGKYSVVWLGKIYYFKKLKFAKIFVDAIKEYEEYLNGNPIDTYLFLCKEGK